MKRLLWIVLLVFIAGCTKKTQLHFVFSAMPDMTDKRSLWPTGKQFQEKLHCDSFPKADYTFRLQAISDKIQNPCIRYHLAGVPTGGIFDETIDNRTRSEAISKFYGAVQFAVDSFYRTNDTSSSKQHSICAIAILNELEFIAKGNFDKATLTIISDLREKSSTWDSYTQPESDPSVIATRLESLRPNMPLLNKITVLLVFTARNTEEDAAFYTIAEGYKRFLESKGAQVEIMATL